MSDYLAILIHQGREIAMQFMTADSDDEADTEALHAINPLSGAWVHVVKVEDDE